MVTLSAARVNEDRSSVVPTASASGPAVPGIPSVGVAVSPPAVRAHQRGEES